MKHFRRLSAFFLVIFLFCSLLPGWAASPESHSTTVLFTHDLHSHFLPREDGAGGETGGYARLKTALNRERIAHPDALTLDGGDFSIGSLIQTLYTTQGAELRTMGALGYDAATVGNHEFDHTGVGFASMLNAVTESGDRYPALLMANYKPAGDNPDKLDIQRAMAAYGVQDYMLLERGGVTYGIFGLMGVDSDACAPASGFVLGDMVSNAQRCVDALRAEGAQFIICLSHGGTSEKKKLSEDERLAEKVSGIDLIVSGHSHTTLYEPIVVNDTYIVSAGPYCRNLGSITINWSEDGSRSLSDYRLIPIDETLAEDAEITDMIDRWKRLVGGSYLGRYGLSYDQVLTRADFDLPTPASGVQSGNALGELVADAFLWAAYYLDADAPDIFDVPTVTVTASGVLRAPLTKGEITTSMAFDVLSMGVGSDGTSGFPLVGVYLTGKELKAIAEVDASVTPLMPAAQLYVSGMDYAFNTHRMFFNRVTEAGLHQMVEFRYDYMMYDAEGNPVPPPTFTHDFYEEIEDDQLYRVVTGMYSAQMLGTVKGKSLGLLSLEPKMADGTPVTDFEECILRDASGNEIKEWYALAAYLQSFGEEGVPASRYGRPNGDGRKDVSRSWNPIELVKSPNWITLTAVLVILAGLALISVLTRWLLVAKKRRRYGKGGRGKW